MFLNELLLYRETIEGNINRVRQLVNQGANVNSPVSLFGDSRPIIAAAQNGNLDIVKYLINQGADVNVATKDGVQAIFSAAQNGFLDIVKYLKSQGANVNAPTKDRWQPIIIAAQNGHVDVARYLISQGADVNAAQNDGVSPIMASVQNGNMNMIIFLCSQGANVNAATKDGNRSIFVAVKKGNLDIVRYLINQGANVNVAQNNGSTPFYIAAEYGHLNIVKYLINRGADINATANDGAHSIIVAAQNGHLSVLEYLINKGADVNASTNEGVQPIMVASQNGHLHIVKYLTSQGANIHATRTDGVQSIIVGAKNGHIDIVKHLINQGALFNAETNDGLQPIIISAQNGHLDIVQYLINQGADVNAATNDGLQPIYVASQNGHLDIVKYLINRGADVNAATNDGARPIMVATQNGHLNIVRYLIAHGANVHVKDRIGCQSIYIAAQYGHLDIVKYLINQDADVNAPTKDGAQPIIIAAQNGHLDIVKYLINQGADAKAATYNGAQSINLAAQNGHLDIVRYLINQGICVDTAGDDGFRPIIDAAQNGHFQIVKLLVDQGANVKATAKNGFQSIIMSAQNGHFDIVKYLINQGADVNATAIDGVQPIYVASQNGHLDIVKYLINQGANAKAVTNEGYYPIIVASLYGFLDITKILVNQGADVNAKANNGMQSIIAAVQDGNLEIVKYLIDKGANIKAATNDGYQPIMFASQNGHLNLVKFLVNHGANASAVANDGIRSIHLASELGKVDVIKYLINFAGVSISNCLSQNSILRYFNVFSSSNYEETFEVLTHNVDFKLKNNLLFNNNNFPYKRFHLFLKSYFSHAKTAEFLTKAEQAKIFPISDFIRKDFSRLWHVVNSGIEKVFFLYIQNRDFYPEHIMKPFFDGRSPLLIAFLKNLNFPKAFFQKKLSKNKEFVQECIRHEKLNWLNTASKELLIREVYSSFKAAIESENINIVLAIKHFLGNNQIDYEELAKSSNSKKIRRLFNLSTEFQNSKFIEMSKNFPVFDGTIDKESNEMSIQKKGKKSIAHEVIDEYILGDFCCLSKSKNYSSKSSFGAQTRNEKSRSSSSPNTIEKIFSPGNCKFNCKKKEDCKIVENLLSLVINIKDKLAKENRIFEFLKPRVHLTGSIVEGTRVGKASEVDCFLVFEEFEKNPLLIKKDCFNLKVPNSYKNSPFSRFIQKNETFDFPSFFNYFLESLNKVILNINIPKGFELCSKDGKFRPCKNCRYRENYINADSIYTPYRHCKNCVPNVTHTKVGSCIVLKSNRMGVPFVTIDFIPFFNVNGETGLKMMENVVIALRKETPEGWKKYLQTLFKSDIFLQEFFQDNFQAKTESLITLKILNYSPNNTYVLRPSQELQTNSAFMNEKLKKVYTFIKVLTSFLDIKVKSYLIKKIIVSMKETREKDLNSIMTDVMSHPEVIEEFKKKIHLRHVKGFKTPNFIDLM